MPKTAPCLWFDGQAEAAASHYVSIFPNSKITRHPYGPDMPGDVEGETMVVELQPRRPGVRRASTAARSSRSRRRSFQIHCADQDEVDHYWERLTEGGEEGPCGWLKDRFGVSWQVVPTRLLELVSDDDKARAQRATQAMLQMRKIDIAEMERAADGVTA